MGSEIRKMGPLTFDTEGEIIIFIERIAVLLALIRTSLRIHPPSSYEHHPTLTFCAFAPLRGAIMKPKVAAKNLSKFDPKTFLSTMDGGRKIAAFPKKHIIFAQGDSSDAVFYIQKGKVKLTVVSQIGKEATIGILNEGDFCGASRAGTPKRSSIPAFGLTALLQQCRHH
jgi:hypothetical protein